MKNIKNNALIVGVDIGGSHISAALIDLKRKCLLPSTHVVRPVNSHGTVEEIMDSWAGTIQEVMNFHPQKTTHIGIAMPGPFDYENGICYMANVNKYDALYGLDVKKLLCEKLPIQPSDILMRNDAESFLEGEVMLGAANGFRKALGITLGTGLGTAVSRNGETEDAALGINEPLLTGVAEDYISTRWFVKRYHEMTGKSVKGVKELTDFIKDDPSVQLIFDEFSGNLAAFVKIFIEKENPDVVVIGGKIANASPFFMPQMMKEMRVYHNIVDFRKSWHDDAAPLIGAAYLWKKKVKTMILENSLEH
jgi:glucokinase